MCGPTSTEPPPRSDTTIPPIVNIIYSYISLLIIKWNLKSTDVKRVTTFSTYPSIFEGNWAYALKEKQDIVSQRSEQCHGFFIRAIVNKKFQKRIEKRKIVSHCRTYRVLTIVIRLMYYANSPLNNNVVTIVGTIVPVEVTLKVRLLSYLRYPSCNQIKIFSTLIWCIVTIESHSSNPTFYESWCGSNMSVL